MRALKFRAWDKKLKQMVHVLEMQFLFESEDGIWIKGYDNSSIDHEIFPENLELMQWTGLKDRNGVNIYECDIVETRSGGMRIIVWRNGAFHSQEIGWKENSGMATHPVFFWGLTPDLCPTVIGNIHQNPELVTVKR